MITGALLALLCAAGPVDALSLAARGLELLSAGEVRAAVHLLERAQQMDPASPIILRNLAAAYAQEKRTELALEVIDRAIALGDEEAEALELRAMLLADLGRAAEAAEAAKEARSWEGDLIGAAVGDSRAADRAGAIAEEPTARGALAAVVLAAHAAARGERIAARNLVAAAEERADRTGSSATQAAAQELRERLVASEGIGFAARLRTSFDYATNPLYAAEGTGEARSGFRWAIAGEAAARVPLGLMRLDLSLRIDQQVHLLERDRFRQLDVSGFSAATRVEVPLDDRLDSASIGLAIRVRDVFGDLFRTHYATAFEGGPLLILPLDLDNRVELGVYGVVADFVDNEPLDAEISSQNRDHTGQRAVASIVFQTEWLHGRVDAMFLRDDAAGDAFDSRGGAAAGRITAAIPGGFYLDTGIGLTVRQFGPVGEEAVIGDASKRAEFRTVVELGVRIPLSDNLLFFVEDTWVRNSARRDHAYTDNVLSTGVETSWW